MIEVLLGGEQPNPKYNVAVPTEGLHVTNLDGGGIYLENTGSLTVGWAKAEIEAFGNVTETAGPEDVLTTKQPEVWVFPAPGEAFGNVTLGTA